MNVLLIGAGFHNKGAEAMTCAVQDELARRLVGVRFFVTQDAVKTNTQAHYAAAGIGVFSGRIPTLERIRFSVLMPRLQLGKSKWNHLLGAICSADAVVDISGYAYGDPWGGGLAKMACRAATICRHERKPYVFFPQAWGPFENEEVREYCARACRRARLVSARDSVSRDYLNHLPGLDPQHICMTPDIAFRLAASPPETGAAILSRMGLFDGTPTVGIAPNMNIYRRTPGSESANRYVQCLGDLCRLLRRLGAYVILIPHHTVPGETGAVDDRLLCGLVEGAVADSKVVAWNETPCAADIKSVIGHLEMIVGSRYHALVAALSSGIPVFALSWSHKYAELLRPFGLERYLVGLDVPDQESLRRQVAECFARRNELKQTVEAVLPAIRREVDLFFDRVAAIIGEPH